MVNLIVFLLTKKDLYLVDLLSNEKLRIVIVMSVTNKGNLMSCVSLKNCMKHYIY